MLVGEPAALQDLRGRRNSVLSENEYVERADKVGVTSAHLMIVVRLAIARHWLGLELSTDDGNMPGDSTAGPLPERFC